MVLDHVYGKPSTTWKRAEALLVAFACAKILRAYHGRPPPGGKHIRALDHSLRKFAPWQIVLGTLTSGYLLSKFSLFTFTNSPEPYARYYNKNFYRATWILTALDAGFWTAMHIKPKPLRDVASILFTVFYLIFANRADYKVRRLRATPTLEMLRLSWEKQKHPLFSAMSSLMQPKIQWKGKQIHLPRSPASPGYIPSDPRTHTTILWLYFDGLPTDLAHVRNVILHFPGGGFVCMGPECHEDYLVEWAHRSPYTLVVAVDYLKAPEYPYPAAHDELFDLYRLIRETNGECLGLSGWTHEVSTSGFSSAGGSAKPAPERRRREPIKLTLSGDSAGGNLAAGIVTRCIETRVMLPDALILIYPHLEFDMACWMTPQNQNLARVESLKNVNAHVNIHRPGSMLNLSQQHGVGGALPSAIPVSAHQETVASSDNLAAQQQHHAADPMSLSIDMDDEMGEGDEYGNGGGTGLRRKRSFFALAQAKLSVLRTQKPHTVFDDYGGTPTAEHHHTFGGTPTTGTAPGSLMPKSPMFRPSTSRASSPGRSVAGSVYGGGSPYATLALTSHMANFNDRVLAPETMRALALLYVGPSMEPIDLMNDYYLSPRRTPDHILAQYPKTYFVVGERDPLVDDTVVTAGRIREAKQRAWAAGPRNTPRPSDTDICEVVILEGISHAILQMMAFLPEAKDTALLIHSWFQETFYPTTAPSAPAAALAPLTRSLVAKHQPVVQVTAAAPVEPVAAILPTIRTTATAAPTAKLAATTNITASTKPAAAAEPAPTTRTAGGTKFTLGGDMLDGLVAAVTGDESLDALVTRATSPIRGRSPVSAVRSPMTPTPARPLVAVVAPAVTITTSAAAAGAPVVVVAAPAVGAVAAAANDDSATANDDDQYLESRDNARVAQNMLLTRRTMQMSQGLFGESQQADKAFRQRVTAGSPASGVASSSSSGSSSKKTSSKKATKSRPTAAPAAAAASSEPDVE